MLIKKVLWRPLNQAITSIILLISLCGLNCSSSKPEEGTNKFEIQYYTVGGIGGLSEGLTVTSDGWAKFWSGATAFSAVVKDSIKIVDEKLKVISEIINSEELFNYQHSSKGNISTVLTLHRGRTSHTIMFGGVQPPESAPVEFKKLINQLHQIK